MMKNFDVREAVASLGRAVVASDIKRGAATLSDIDQWKLLSSQIISKLDVDLVDTVAVWRALVDLQSICLVGFSFMSNPNYGSKLQDSLKGYFIGLLLEVMAIERRLLDIRATSS